MPDPRLPAIKEVNSLPFYQHVLKKLQQVNCPVDHQALYPAQLLIWARDNRKIDLESEIADNLEFLLEMPAQRAAYLLRLEDLTPHNGPESTAQDLVDELRDRMLGIKPEEV
jgi:hypothetical protein